MSNVYGIQKAGHNFDVFTDEEKTQVQTIIMDSAPEVAAIIQETPAGSYLVKFVHTERGHRVASPWLTPTLDKAVNAAINTLLTLEV